MATFTIILIFCIILAKHVECEEETDDNLAETDENSTETNDNSAETNDNSAETEETDDDPRIRRRK